MFLEFKNIAKRFPGAVALNDVSLGIERGACHALMGENGAGKSTLGKILAGVYTADGGEILLEGKRIAPADPLAARRLGIAMVHQELAFCPNLSVAENLCLGELPRFLAPIDRRGMRARARRMLEEIGADFDLDAPMEELTTAQEQMAQIAAALGVGARIIVMDEPTSSLSALESEHLFTLLRRLKERGITVIYVSHRMEEIFRLCDTVSVLRDGKHVATEAISKTTPARLIQQMVGRTVSTNRPAHLDRSPGGELLRVKNLSSPGKFKNISFTLHSGEVLGFAGLVGAGRSEVAAALFGLDPDATGEVFVHGEPIKLGSPQAALRAGLGLCPEDRKRQGLALSMTCAENATLAALPELTRNGFIRREEERSIVSKFFQRLRVRTPGLDAPVAGLSGGNQQKIALAKWLVRKCGILVVDEPTRGVDVGAKAEMHALLDQLACNGAGLLVISSELPEVTSLSRRLIVMRAGAIAGELTREQFAEETIMSLMAGYG